MIYVPEIGINLFSIAAATEAGMEESFKDHQMTIYMNNELIYYEERAGLTLYHLHAKSNILVNDVANFADHLDTIPIAHRRMGHINMRTLRRMHHKKIVDGLNLTDVTQVEKNPPICSGCAKGKIHRLSFSDGRRKTCIIGELIHSDVCGPMSYTSIGSERYFVVFRGIRKTTSVVLLQSTS